MMNSKKEIIKSIFVGLFFIVILAFPFLHMGFSKLQNWQPYKTHYKKYNRIINSSNAANEKLLSALKEGEISIHEYSDRYQEILTEKSVNLKNYHKMKKKLKEEYSFMGYSSFRYFLYAIGLPVFSLVLTIFFLSFMLVNQGVAIMKKRLYITIGIGFVFVSSFWVLQALLVRTDFPNRVYGYSLVCVAIITTLIVYSGLRYFNYLKSVQKQKDEDTEEFIRTGLNFIDDLNKTIVG
ncbi:hypothetical protein [Tenacibaculum litopenaei]|uniref:hypothetical protein n=1 Tax=Tenacibaculum litopenaei TaxID=396016 RepID=UPI0038B556EE